MISFDVKSSFRSIPLDKTIEIILQHLYNCNKITTQITKEVMEKLLWLCTKEGHFAYSNGTYQQNDSMAMGSPVGPVLAGIFMVDFETSIIPTLGRSLLKWKRYADDRFCYVQIGTVNDILNKLKIFHQNIQFTYKLEKNSKLAF